jgi:hypothetical protein
MLGTRLQMSGLKEAVGLQRCFNNAQFDIRAEDSEASPRYSVPWHLRLSCHEV